MTVELDRIIRRLNEDGEKTASFFEELSPSDWSQQVYTTGSSWSVRDVLAHFLSAEISFEALVTDVISGGSGAPRDLDINDFNESEVPKLDHLAPPELLARYRDARGKTVDLVETLAASDLEKSGFHPWFGEVKVAQMLKLVYRHNMIHFRDIRRALKDGLPVPHKELEPPSQG